MATAENTTVKLYRGVPLVKDGTEVLFLSGSAAEAALSGYTAFTDTKYYYTRENRESVQVESAIGPLEGCNYIGFQNQSHGGKWYFGFIDRLVYVNDRNTQVEFTVDPFTTYLGDCAELDDYYVVRNTDKTDIRGQNLQDDYQAKSDRKNVTVLDTYTLTLDYNETYFAAGEITAVQLGNTGIKIAGLTDANLKAILEKGGTIIGAYMFPSAWITGASVPTTIQLPAISGNPIGALTATHNKIKTGVYNKVMLITSQGSKSYDMEAFSNPQNVTFQLVGLTIPSPAIFAYPLNYNGIAHNVAEGVMCKAPALPIAANATYTNAQAVNDVTAGVLGIGTGAVTGFLKGGVTGALIGSGIAAAGAVFNQAKNETMATFKAPSIIGAGEPVVNLDKQIFCSVAVARPDANDISRVDKYMDYFGYAVNAQKLDSTAFPSGVNTDDGAYLQTGSEMFAGSEGAEEINARLASGIKIRKTL